MSDFSKLLAHLPEEQQAIQAKSVHPVGSSVQFAQEEIEQSIPERFEKIVEMYADRIAIKMGETVVSYRDLNDMANGVARTVLKLHADRDDPVALWLEDSTFLIISMIGVLKAGKVFALVDPSLPKTKLVSLLVDLRSSLVITSSPHRLLARDLPSNVVTILELESIKNLASSVNLGLSISPTAAAFIIYTSGSAGVPKGVIWNHRHLLYHVYLHTNTSRLCQNDRLTLLSSGAGNTVTNIFLGLLNGAAVLRFDLRENNTGRLAEWLIKERVSACLLSSSLFRSLCAMLTGKEKFPDLRFIRLRSESVYKTDFDRYKAFFPPTCVFATGLSSSETGLLSTYRLTHDSEIEGPEVPVGYPVEGKEVCLLDDEGNNVGYNKIGEIVVRSKHLSSGYWNNPELTAAKFKSDLEDRDKRLYYTGDLGLMLPDGCLIHKGRKDFRVKIRGYGVDLVEVEKALRSHDGIREAAVIARQSSSGEPQLIAYFTTVSQREPSVGELRAFLKQKLAEYMIPSAFVMLETIPLTPNGKLDRRALPEPAEIRRQLNTEFAAPRSAIEEKLVQIWQEVLGIHCVGIHDNFFDLGGHSLAAAGLMSKLAQEYEVDLSIWTLVESSTIQELARQIEAERDSRRIRGWTYVVEFQPGADCGPVFFYPADWVARPNFLYTRDWLAISDRSIASMD